MTEIRYRIYRGKNCIHLKQVLTEVTENLIQSLIGQVDVVKAKDPHRGKHLKAHKNLFDSTPKTETILMSTHSEEKNSNVHYIQI